MYFYTKTLKEIEFCNLFYSLRFNEISYKLDFDSKKVQKSSTQQKYLAGCEEEEIEDCSSDDIKPNIIITNVNIIKIYNFISSFNVNSIIGRKK